VLARLHEDVIARGIEIARSDEEEECGALASDREVEAVRERKGRGGTISGVACRWSRWVPRCCRGLGSPGVWSEAFDFVCST